MAITEAQRKAHEKYFADKWTQVKLSMPNDEASALRKYCSDHGLTVAGFIRSLVRDAIGDPAQGTPEGYSRGPESGGVTLSNNSAEEKPD